MKIVLYQIIKKKVNISLNKKRFYWREVFFFLLTIRSAVHLCNAMLSLVVHAVHADMKVHVFRIAEKCITRISGKYIFCNYSYHHIVRTNHQRINSFYSLYLLFCRCQCHWSKWSNPVFFIDRFSQELKEKYLVFVNKMPYFTFLKFTYFFIVDLIRFFATWKTRETSLHTCTYFMTDSSIILGGLLSTNNAVF